MSGDLISLEDAIEAIASVDITDGTEPVFSGKQVIGLLKDLDTINPQEPKTDVLDKIRAELHETAEMHEDGDYYLRDEWIDEYFDKYKAESEDKCKNCKYYRNPDYTRCHKCKAESEDKE